MCIAKVKDHRNESNALHKSMLMALPKEYFYYNFGFSISTLYNPF